LLSALLFLYHFTRKILNPLDKINQTARAYSNGSFDEKLEISDKNEIGELANSLNDMADELQKMEDYRKNFIANVSHDFRSPLTSINGYLKAIQEGVIPPERQSHYIDVVLNETKRLTKLTSGLLTLNDFNSNSLIVKKSVFNINEIILSTIDAFEGNAIKKNVSILPDISSKPLKVYADKEKIYQVLYNLIDNALKFSHPNSTIFVTALPADNDKVTISVKDNGDGISKEHQKHIWERFYKADSSRGKDKSGTGLGLSIVREIIKAHDETITLQSKAGSGSTFQFTLPAVKESQS
jgi:signal transduction histidine kinase